MISAPLITVVVSTYNQEAYLGECLEALANELVEIDAEIVVADDCSTDITRKIAEDFSVKYPGLIKLLERQPNLGPNLNYLRGHSAASGKYVAHVDGDDVVVRGKIRRQMEVFENDPSVNLVLHSAEYFSDSGKIVFVTGLNKPDCAEWQFSRLDLACWGPISVHSSFMYRRDSVSLSEASPPFMEWFVAMNCLKEGKGVFVNERLVRYRYNLGGEAWTASAAGRQEVYEIQWKNVRNFFNEYPKLRPYLYAQVVVNVIGLLRAKSKLPSGMLCWLFREIVNFRFPLIISSLRIRATLRPRRP